MKKYILKTLALALALSATSCKKYLDLQPVDSPTEQKFYTDAKGLQGGVVSCYDALQDTKLYGLNLLTLAENRGDNIQDNNSGASGGVFYQIESFSELPDNTVLSDTWLGLYNAIYRCNIIIDRAPKVNMDATLKKQIIGQATFIRALSYFHLTRLWGNAPLITTVQTTDEARKNKRVDAAAIYTQIVTDLTLSSASLPDTWTDAERGKATRFAALALLGKVYLYQKKYDLAASTLKPVVDAINAGTVLALVPQTTTFPGNIKTSKDVLFAVQYLSGGVGESANQNNRYRNQDGSNIITLPQTLFETGDNRKVLVAPAASGTRPGKFNTPQVNNETSGDMPVLRCAEVMLMYAEALNGTSYPNADAFTALNKVRSNAGITALTAATLSNQAAFRTEIYKQRRLELALECDRWFDILRTGQMKTVFPLVPDNRNVYPVPQTEIQNINDKTGWQNPGY